VRSPFSWFTEIIPLGAFWIAFGRGIYRQSQAMRTWLRRYGVVTLMAGTIVLAFVYALASKVGWRFKVATLLFVGLARLYLVGKSLTRRQTI
jgi:uncharacterized membrane protein